jgi:hypothetical protein
MSTRINVTVGDGGLLDRNAQQTAANRQARVLADQRATAKAEGVERRAADRTAAGLDPLTGLPASTPSSASTINRLDQEPAANRRPTGLNFFYLKITKAQGSNLPVAQVVSGDGAKASKRVFEYVDFTEVALKEAGNFVGKVEQWEPGFNTNWIQGLNSISAFRTTIVDEDPVTGITTTTVENYSARRFIQGRDRSHLLCLPLGKGKALVVLVRKILFFVWREDEYSQVTRVSTIFGGGTTLSRTLDTYFATSEVVVQPDSLLEYAAFVVDNSTARSVPLPDNFIAQLFTLLPDPEIRTGTKIWTAPLCPDADQSLCSGGFGQTVETTTYELDPQLSTSFPNTDAFFGGDPVVFLQYLNIPSTDAEWTYRNALQYGISDQGGITSQVMSTPAAWFAVDSPDNIAILVGTGSYFGPGYLDAGSLTSGATHEQVLNLQVSDTGAKVKSILSPSSILGVPSDQTNFAGTLASMVSKGQTYKWADRGQHMDLAARAAPFSPVPANPYPYGQEAGFWLGSGLKFKEGLTSPNFDSLDVDLAGGWKRVLIHDWGNPAFCRQQAARYGLISL